MYAHTLIGLSITPFFSRAELSISLLFFLFTKLAAGILFHYYLLLLLFIIIIIIIIIFKTESALGKIRILQCQIVLR